MSLDSFVVAWFIRGMPRCRLVHLGSLSSSVGRREVVGSFGSFGGA